MIAAESHAAPMIGQVLRQRRGHHGWTLADLSEKTGISRSTLSKIENDLVSPSYQTIIQLCSGLEIEIRDLLAPSGGDDSSSILTGRRSISRGHAGLVMEDDNYRYTYLCTDIAHKRIVPMVIDVQADSLNRVDGLWTHVGEEYLYVLKGAITLHTQLYEAEVLNVGDSVYFDSTMAHAYIAVGGEAAQILVMCSSATPNLAQTLREWLKRRLKTTAAPGSA